MSDISSQTAARHLKQGRSSVTNGKRALIGVNTSSQYGRRYRDLIAAFSAEIGEVLSASEAAMVKQAAALTVRSEMMQAQILNGEDTSPDDLIRISSEARRILDAIKGKAGSKPNAPRLDEYLRNKSGGAAA